MTPLVDGLLCNAGDLELDALVNWKPVTVSPVRQAGSRFTNPEG